MPTKDRARQGPVTSVGLDSEAEIRVAQPIEERCDTTTWSMAIDAAKIATQLGARKRKLTQAETGRSSAITAHRTCRRLPSAGDLHSARFPEALE